MVTGTESSYATYCTPDTPCARCNRKGMGALVHICGDNRREEGGTGPECISCHDARRIQEILKGMPSVPS
jgi:hypothetical protein